MFPNNVLIKIAPSYFLNVMALNGFTVEWDVTSETKEVVINVKFDTSSESYGFIVKLISLEEGQYGDTDEFTGELTKKNELDFIATYIANKINSGEVFDVNAKSLLESTEEWLESSGKKQELIDIVNSLLIIESK